MLLDKMCHDCPKFQEALPAKRLFTKMMVDAVKMLHNLLQLKMIGFKKVKGEILEES